ncbi:MAG: UDP-N-acetylglucosamine 2-epimerase [Proteobacteria bacterium]|nr:UDP-N-acetylglucosamine 2-epimerase [Pseudomonadota bacterium]
MKKIVAISSSRADYSHLYWPLKNIENSSKLDLTVLAFGPHLSPMYGESWQQIKQQGYKIRTVESLINSDSDVGMAKTLAISMLGITEILADLRPDLVLIIADRYEMLAAANVALTLRIPIAHIEGGDVSEGAIDDVVRNALTKMSHLHFTPTERATQRVHAMGEESWRITHSGAPSLDHLYQQHNLPEPDEINKKLNLDKQRLLVIAYHSVTLLDDPLAEQKQVFAALEHHAIKHPEDQMVFCFPNTDTGSHQLIKHCKTFCQNHSWAQIQTNLSAQSYLALLKRADLMFGNSSSGIMESPSLKIPCIDIGQRQKGREKADNIIQSRSGKQHIIKAMEKALSKTFKNSIQSVTNPYGNGTASTKILKVLENLPNKQTLLLKKNIL